MKFPPLPVLAALGLSLVLPAAVTVSAAPATSQPNVVIFLVDDMGVMDTSVPFLTDSAGKPQRHPLNDYYRTPKIGRAHV